MHVFFIGTTSMDNMTAADFERIVEKNLGDGPFFGGASPVLADLALFLVAESTIDEMKFVAVRGEQM